MDGAARFLTTVALTVVFGMIADHAMAQTIKGTATYRERMALPAGAVFEATIEDVSRADAPASEIATTRVASPGNPPIAFAIAYDQARIDSSHRYVVRAKILLDGKLLFASDVATPVITRSSPTTVSMMLRRVAGGQTSPPATGANRSRGATNGRETALRSGRWLALKWRARTPPMSSADFGTLCRARADCVLPALDWSSSTQLAHGWRPSRAGLRLRQPRAHRGWRGRRR